MAGYAPEDDLPKAEADSPCHASSRAEDKARVRGRDEFEEHEVGDGHNSRSQGYFYLASKAALSI